MGHSVAARGTNERKLAWICPRNMQKCMLSHFCLEMYLSHIVVSATGSTKSENFRLLGEMGSGPGPGRGPGPGPGRRGCPQAGTGPGRVEPTNFLSERYELQKEAKM